MLELREWGPQPIDSLVLASSDAFMLEIGNGNLATTPRVSGMPPHSSDAKMASSESVEWIPLTHQVSRVLVEVFKNVREVKSICAQFGPEEVTVWTLLESHDRKAREKVYKKELEVCRILGVYDFEFRVTSFDLVSPEDLARTGLREIYRRD